MDKTLKALADFGESTERAESYDLNVDYGTDFVISDEDFPRIGVSGLIAERDLSLAVFVDKSLDINLDFVTDGNNLRRILDSLPGKLGDMNHTLGSADINECTVRNDGLNGTDIFLTLFGILPYLFEAFAAFDILSGTDGTYGTFLLFVSFDDEKLYGLTDTIGKFRALGYTEKRTGDKDTDTLRISENAALDSLCNRCFKHFLVFIGFNDLVPCVLVVETTL